MHHESGFTLLELLTVVTIIGVIAATAIPQYATYRKRAFDVRAKTDLRNLATAEEAYFMDAEHYLSCSDAACKALPGIASLSRGVTVSMTATESGFTGEASHERGSGTAFHWDSAAGGLRED